jgi:peptidyl-prolyl cis-trans isomerase SurA
VVQRLQARQQALDGAVFQIDSPASADRHRRRRQLLRRDVPATPCINRTDRALRRPARAAAAVRTDFLDANLLLALVLARSPRPAQGRPLVDRIVAVVNKEVITYSELREAVGQAERQLARQGTQAPERAILERQMLERLILDKAQLQWARETGLRIDELQIDRAVERIAQSEQDDARRLSQGARGRRGTVRRVPQRRAPADDPGAGARARGRQPHPGERDRGRSFPREHEGAPRRRRVQHPAHPGAVAEQASPERIAEARKRAESALADAKAGSPFARVAASYSDAPDALQGGALGWRSHERLPELFANALAGLQPGDLSEILRSPAGFHILKLNDKRGTGAEAPVRQTRIRHILIRTNEMVSEADARRKLLDLRERIVSGGADFAELARANSDDGTAARGGELDWVFPGDTVPEFERAYEALKVGEVSQPVRTPFGYHLIQVLERRSSDLCRSAAACRRGRRSAIARRTRRTRSGCASCATRPTSSSGLRTSAKPVIALPPASPAGIGPELCVRLAQQSLPAEAGRHRRSRAARRLSSHRTRAARTTSKPGTLDPANAPYVLAVLDRAVRGCLSGEYDAMVTAPVQKSVINDAALPSTGHTEYLAEHARAPQVVMMLVGGGLRVALATTHLPLSEVPRAITIDGLLAHAAGAEPGPEAALSHCAPAHPGGRAQSAQRRIGPHGTRGHRT